MGMSASFGTRPGPGGFLSPTLLAWWLRLPRSLARCIAPGLLATLAAASALAAPGELDPTFGDAGRTRMSLVTYDEYGNPIDLYADVEAIAQQADGKLLLGGAASMPVSYYDFLIIRLNADGSLDTTFDSDGWATIDIVPGAEYGSDDRLYALATQADGKIVAVGQTRDTSSTGAVDMALVRLNDDGSRDTGFGTNGVVV